MVSLEGFSSLILGAAPGGKFSFLTAITGASVPEKVIMFILMIMSIISWAIIIMKWGGNRRAFKTSDKFLEMFWSSKKLDDVFNRSESFGNSPVAQVFRAGYIELAKLKKIKSAEQSQNDFSEMGDIENVQRALRRASSAERTEMESYIPFLATIGSASPFIGLLGTVLGIMTSFFGIAASGNTSLQTVAPGIGAALAATAIGLFAAIPAVMAYNYFVGRIKLISIEMDNFSSDFLNIVKRHFF